MNQQRIQIEKEKRKKRRDLGGISSNRKTRPFGFWGRQIEPDFDIFIMSY